MKISNTTEVSNVSWRWWGLCIIIIIIYQQQDGTTVVVDIYIPLNGC